MTALDDLFQRLRDEGKRAFMPFITAGDPNLATTLATLDAFERIGCSMAEVGVPYSDPIADGPVIQASYTRALQSKIRLETIFESLTQFRAQHSMPVVTMVSYAIIHRQGVMKFIQRAKDAGVAGAIVPDLPIEESAELARVCRSLQFDLIPLIAPTTPPERAIRIAENASGFLYFVSVTGITGERRELPEGLVERISWLRARTSLPICVGFGISLPEHVRLLRSVADGLIVGSAFVRLLAEAPEIGAETAIAKVTDLASSLLGALNAEE